MSLLHSLAEILAPFDHVALCVLAVTSLVATARHIHHERLTRATLEHVRKHLTNGKKETP